MFHCVHYDRSFYTCIYIKVILTIIKTSVIVTGSGPSNGSSASYTDHSMTSGASANANGCPTFLASCRQDCVTLDGHGCPVCMCTSGKETASGSTGKEHFYEHSHDL